MIAALDLLQAAGLLCGIVGAVLVSGTSAASRGRWSLISSDQYALTAGGVA